MLWEEDIYIGPNKYTTVDGTFEEMLRITYYFKDNKWGYLWTTGVSVKNSRWEHEQDEEISSKEADSLLTLWGII
jgi:SRSO17 transposase